MYMKCMLHFSLHNYLLRTQNTTISIDLRARASSQLTTNNHWHWPCYCTVHVCVDIHFCNSMWSFWVEVNLCRFCFYHLFNICISLDIQLSRGENWDPINRFKSTTFLWLFQGMSYIFNDVISFLCSVTSVEMRGDCSFSFNGKGHDIGSRAYDA